MKPAYTEIGEHSVTFAFSDGRGKDYLVTGRKLDIEEAKQLVESRMRAFHEHEGSRESFIHKVLRKLLAAQGETFNRRLMGHFSTMRLKDHRMEHKMMMSADSHTSTTTKAEFDRIKRDPATERLFVDGDGCISGDQPNYLHDQTGRIFLGN